MGGAVKELLVAVGHVGWLGARGWRARGSVFGFVAVQREVFGGGKRVGGVVAFFALVIAVDVVFMVLAYRTFSGQVASNPYEAGLAFNQTLAQRQREASLGWSAAVTLLVRR